LKKNHKAFWFTIALALTAAAIALWIAWGNTALMTTHISVTDIDLPEAFDGFRVLHMSDTHDALIGKENSGLIEAAAEAQPDIIVLTGDIVDANRINIPRSLSLTERLTEIAPVYYVNGNHEASISKEEYILLTEGLCACGVTVLEDTAVLLERDGAAIQLIGLKDIGHLEPEWTMELRTDHIARMLAALTEEQYFRLTLSHRPELADTYAESGVNLVLCGHAHGGQVRLPILGGLIAPGQGLLPQYDAGLYAVGSTQMIVSRGIGNSKFPFRVNNRPEIVLIELIAGQQS